MFFQIHNNTITDFWVGYGAGRGNEMEDKAQIQNWLKMAGDRLHTNIVEY